MVHTMPVLRLSPPPTHTHKHRAATADFRSERMTDLHRFCTQECLPEPLKHCFSFIPRTTRKFTNITRFHSCTNVKACLPALCPQFPFSLCTCAEMHHDSHVLLYFLSVQMDHDSHVLLGIIHISRVGQNHIYIRYFWQRNHKIYGHIRCTYMVLANPNHDSHVFPLRTDGP